MTKQGIRSASPNEFVCLFAITLKMTPENILHDIYRNFKCIQRLKIFSVALAKPKELLSFNVLLMNKHCCSVFVRLTCLALRGRHMTLSRSVDGYSRIDFPFTSF